MPIAATTRRQQRAASSEALLSAARRLYALHGPDGVSLRTVAEEAGLTHALVVRYFGSKNGLVAAVEADLAAHLLDIAPDAEPLVALVRSARRDEASARLVVRCGLGDLGTDRPPTWLCADSPFLASPTGAAGVARHDSAARWRDLLAYGAASLALGWITFDEFLTSALGLGRIGVRRRDDAIIDAIAHVLGLSTASTPPLAVPTTRRGTSAPRASTAPTTVDADPHSSREALLAAAIELFAEHGPASASIRDVARRAGVNHGLVHRHFGTKDDLLAAAIEAGVVPVLPGVQAPGGFDIPQVAHLLHHHSSAPRLIARTSVDDVPISTVRHSYPVMRGLLALTESRPASSRPPGLADPRLATAAAGALVGGSTIWGRRLREALGIDDEDVAVAAVVTLVELLIGNPGRAR